MTDLILELFSEEIPARMQTGARADLERLTSAALQESGVHFGAMQSYSTPRRLVLHLSDLPDKSADRSEERKGPRVDAPPKAIEGFLRSSGLRLEELETRDDKKGAVYFACINRPGKPVEEVLRQIIPDIIRKFPWPKSMRWGSGSFRWARPLHHILCVLSAPGGARHVALDVKGIPLSKVSHGHRVHGKSAVEVTDFASLEAGLRRNGVILDHQERLKAIHDGAQRLAREAGLELVVDAALCREIAGLVEWPVPIIGAIPERYWNLPPEVLQTSMREHQKFLSLRDPGKDQITHFVTIANIEAADGGAAIIKGNEKVLNARLADAEFFWNNDLQRNSQIRLEKLNAVTFHAKLGTQAERVERLCALAASLSPLVGAAAPAARRAAKLAKSDLSSEMVYEFPELQGIMGRYYALKVGEPAEIADAVRDHYLPASAQDETPKAPVSIAVSLADKLDMLAGFWVIDEKPTGSRDPFALRRAALGVIRIVLDNGLSLPLRPVLEAHISDHYPDADAPRTTDSLLQFMADRLQVLLRERRLRHDVINAALVDPGDFDLYDLSFRVEALEAFLRSEDGVNLEAAYKRGASLLKAEERGGQGFAGRIDPDLLNAAEEAALNAALGEVDSELDQAIKLADYERALMALAGLRSPLDAFFDKVTVNAENTELRLNRLALLTAIRTTMHKVARFDQLEG